MEIQDRLSQVAEAVDARLDALLPDASKPPSELHQAMRYSALAPGKRLRPALCMASAAAVGASPESVLDAGCALELVHCFSLIHDDLPAIDDDDLRRGLPTCHRKFGEAIAILAGDALFALAYEVLSSSPHPPEPVVQSLRILSRAVGSDGLVGGEVTDVLAEGRPADEPTVQFIHTRKTGALIAAGCQIGAVLSGASATQASLLLEFGERIGLAFQIADDILNETGTAERLGKSAGSDRDRMKATYPAVFGLEGSRSAAAAAVDQALDVLGALEGDTRFLAELAAYSIDRIH